MKYDCIVVGAGHAGCEAALAVARMGKKTMIITINIKNIADMPCNPSIGGSANWWKCKGNCCKINRCIRRRNGAKCG